jgi:hypothetical protein
MDESLQQPKVFANRIIRQLVQHMVAEDMVIDLQDYLAIRVVFRACGGSWIKFGEGDLKQFELLKAIVLAWGQMEDRRKSSDELV